MNAVITGASKGIGLAIASLFVKNNINVAICARSKNTLNEAHRKLRSYNENVEVFSMVADMSESEDIQKFVAMVSKEMKSIDILVNNAGIYIPSKVHNEPKGQLEKIMMVNLYGPYHLTREFMPKFLEQKSGYIFNISSVAGIMPYPNGGSYSISKYALTGFSKALREELKDKGIKVITVYPGATWSDSWSAAKGEIPEDRLMEANDIAEIIYAQLKLSHSAVMEDIIIRPQLGDL